MLLFAGLAAVVYWAGGRALADIVAQEPRYEIERWRAGKVVLDGKRMDAIQAELYKARDLDPGNPYLLDDLGRLYAARVERGQPYDMAVRDIRQQSLDWFRQSLLKRPTSGHAWINVALTKFHLGEIDSEFSQALQQAMRRGPWDPKIQLIAIELGLASWQAQSPEIQQSVKQAIRAQSQWQLVKQKAQLMALLKRYKRLDLTCLLAPAPNACAAS